MSVYVGIDVHRKRSQVAVVTEDGKVQLNKNVVNGSEPMLRLIGDLPSGTPVAFEAAFGWGWLAQPARQGRPAGQDADHAARRRPVHRPGHAGRDRRHHPVLQRPQAGQLGRADPDGPRLGPDHPARAHLRARAQPGCGGS